MIDFAKARVETTYLQGNFIFKRIGKRMARSLQVSTERAIEFLLTVSVLAVRGLHLDRMAHLEENRGNDLIIYAGIRNDSPPPQPILCIEMSNFAREIIYY